jgi:hydrogenase maturation protein HypF
MNVVAATRKKIQIQGTVQGVGFRPFVYRIARQFDIRGFIFNSSDGVVIEAEADEIALHRFLAALQQQLPPLAKIDELTISNLEPRGDQGFTIHQSLPTAAQFVLVPPDVATCEDCLREFRSVADRRYRYPFTNCTNCGPRYTIIRDIPYDRPKTTMVEFAMCPHCRAEYEDPANRRFHAEPNACPDCGPGLALALGEELESGVPTGFATGSKGDIVLERTRHLLRQGEIVAIKGLGGFHLACDASNDHAVDLLRERKRRSGKAFAIMVRDVETAERLCFVGPAERTLLMSPRRPIVLLRSREISGIAGGVAPGNKRLGVMLPYTPLHYLLFEGSPGYEALVMTSGNLSEEPIVCENGEAWPRLHNLADHFLLHNRRIQTRVDDSVVQVFEDSEYPVRRSRGYAPAPIDLGMPLREVLACGGELKNTLCLTKHHYAILSQHIGDLENVETMDFFRETLGHLKRFFRVSPVAAAYDLHPNYLSTRFALEEAGLRPVGVQHHHAHIASCMADNALRGPVIGVALDGTGYGTDGQIWGGEFLVCDFGGFTRRAHFRYVPLPGGDSAIRQPWRSALAHLQATFGSRSSSLPLPVFDAIPRKRIAVVDAMLSHGIQTVNTSSCGRLFDAVASLLGIRHESTYEGQAAIELEMTASEDERTYPFEITGSDPMQVDTRPLIESIARDVIARCGIAAMSARFHRTISHIVGETCVRIRASDGLNRVCLSGGTFQNLRLLGHAVSSLRQLGFKVYIHHRVPPNDGGLSLGQAVVADQILGAGSGNGLFTHV